MALALLQILFIILAVASLLGQFLLYKDKLTVKNSVFIFNVVLGLIFSWIIFTSMPTNYHVQRIISLVWGFLALVALVLKISPKNNILLTKVLLTISIFGAMIHLFIF